MPSERRGQRKDPARALHTSELEQVIALEGRMAGVHPTADSCVIPQGPGPWPNCLLGHIKIPLTCIFRTSALREGHPEARRGSKWGTQCDSEHHEQGLLGLRVSVQEGQGLKTDCSVSSWVGLVLGHVGKMLYIPCHEYACAETHPHSPVYVKAHLNERVLRCAFTYTGHI